MNLFSLIDKLKRNFFDKLRLSFSGQDRLLNTTCP
jgi:hypothetical protein